MFPFSSRVLFALTDLCSAPPSPLHLSLPFAANRVEVSPSGRSPCALVNVGSGPRRRHPFIAVNFQHLPSGKPCCYSARDPLLFC
ncbi:hypothetical protein BKA80DRAFT_269248, partial [Phyllosticta citrichinensis]